MSYVSRPRITKRVARAVDLAGLFDPGGFIDSFAFNGAMEKSVECGQQADAAAQPIYDQQKDVETNWNPTGYYTPDQVAQIMSFVLDMGDQVTAQITSALSDLQLPSGRENLNAAFNNLSKAANDGLPFTQAFQQAKAQGVGIIDASGLKRWVTSYIHTVGDATWLLTNVGCNRPWWVGALQTIQGVVNQVVRVVKAIIGVVVSAGQAVLKVPDVIGDFITYGKWAALLGLGYYAAVKFGVLKQDPLGIVK